MGAGMEVGQFVSPTQCSLLLKVCQVLGKCMKIVKESKMPVISCFPNKCQMVVGENPTSLVKLGSTFTMKNPLLSLMAARYPNQEPIERGIKLIMSRQQSTGEWLPEGIEGVFNKNCMISYPNYKFYFCIWALGRYHNLYEAE
jgi:hypothetical protein